MGGTSDVAAQIAELINSQDNEGRTPLLMACAHGHVECARCVWCFRLTHLSL